MSRICGKGTKPEMLVRRLVHRMGYRYRLHAKDLPGRSDLMFLPATQGDLRSRLLLASAQGCSWNTIPTTRRDFWRQKLNGNAQLDRRNQAALREDGCRVPVIWDTNGDTDRLARLIRGFLR